MLIWFVAAPAPLVTSSYWTCVALNLRYDTAGAMKLVGVRLPGRSAIAGEPRQAKEETQEPTKEHRAPRKKGPAKWGRSPGGGAEAEERCREERQGQEEAGGRRWAREEGGLARGIADRETPLRLALCWLRGG